MENNGKEHVNHPEWYTKHPSGVECITVTRHFCFDIGNAIKYLWRAGLKKEQGMSEIEKEIEDCNKAIWYIKDYIKTLENKLKSNNVSNIESSTNDTKNVNTLVSKMNECCEYKHDFKL